MADRRTGVPPGVPGSRKVNPMMMSNRQRPTGRMSTALQDAGLQNYMPGADESDEEEMGVPLDLSKNKSMAAAPQKRPLEQPSLQPKSVSTIRPDTSAKGKIPASFLQEGDSSSLSEEDPDAMFSNVTMREPSQSIMRNTAAASTKKTSSMKTDDSRKKTVRFTDNSNATSKSKNTGDDSDDDATATFDQMLTSKSQTAMNDPTLPRFGEPSQAMTAPRETKSSAILARKPRTAKSNMMDLSQSVMGPSSSEAQRRTMQEDVSSYGGVKEAEEATVQRMRPIGGNVGGGGSGGAVLFSKRRGTNNQTEVPSASRPSANLMAKSTMDAPKRSNPTNLLAQSVMERPRELLQEPSGRNTTDVSSINFSNQPQRSTQSPKREEPKKEKEKKKFGHRIKGFAQSVLGTTKDVITQQIPGVQFLDQNRDAMAEKVLDTGKQMGEKTKEGLEKAKDKIQEMTGTQQDFVAPQFSRIDSKSVLPSTRPLQVEEGDLARPLTGGRPMRGNLLNNSVYKDATQDMSEFLQSVGQRVENFSNKPSLLNQYNQKRKLGQLGNTQQRQGEGAKAKEADLDAGTSSEDTDLNNSITSSVNLEDMEEKEDELLKEKQRLADLIAGEVSSQSSEDEKQDDEERKDEIEFNKKKNNAQTDFLKMLTNDSDVRDGDENKRGRASSDVHDRRFVDDDLEMLKIIGKNEKCFREAARERLRLKEAPLSLKTTRQQRVEEGYSGFQRVLDGPGSVEKVWTVIKQKAYIEKTRPTAISLSDDLILIGMSNGCLYGFTKEGQKMWGMFHDSGKDFVNNAITCIDVHPKRPEYVVLGYHGGQLVLIDCTELKKSIKIIKDHHNKTPIVSVKFCDWIKERNIKDVLQQNKSQHGTINKKEDKQLWMFVSTDTEGRVVVTTVSNVALGVKKANKIMCVNPEKNMNFQPFPSLACKFHETKYPQKSLGLEGASLIAMGSNIEVSIFNVIKESVYRIFTIMRPKEYPSQNTGRIEQFQKQHQVPCLSWGYGRTPCFNNETYVLLAIAWGPLVQIVVVRDLDSHNQEDFFLDGHYFVAPNTVMMRQDSVQDVSDVWIESMCFLDESLLLVVTNTRTVRVLYTQQFLFGEFKSPEGGWERDLRNQLDQDDSVEGAQAYVAHSKAIFKQIESLDSRAKAMPQGRPLTKEQSDIELERGNQIEKRMWPSQFGSPLSQTVSLHDDSVLFLSEGGLFIMRHLTWTRSIEELQQLRQGNWVEVFARTLEIFTGTVKGFRGLVDDDEIRKQAMRGQMKQLIHENVSNVISAMEQKADTAQTWSTCINAIQNPSMVITNPQLDKQIRDVEKHFKTLIQMSIEFCVEVQEPDFLLRELFQLFVDEGPGNLLAEELKPYILSGQFAEQPFPEDIISQHILAHYQRLLMEAEQDQQKERPNENFEKVLINLNFSDCSQRYKLSVIEFCKRNLLSTGLMHMCLQTYGDNGPSAAIETLINAYSEAVKDEKAKGEEGKIAIQDLRNLSTMPVNSPDRMPVEKSSLYIGYKLFWLIRRFCRGKLFPSGDLARERWNNVVHDLIGCVTTPKNLKVLLDIDPAAYFQIISVCFASQQPAHEFLRAGRYGNNDNVPMSHSLIVSRLANYRNMSSMIEHSSLPSIYFNFFISNIANEEVLSQEKDLFFQVMLELLANHRRFISYHKKMFDKQMQRIQKIRKLKKVEREELAEKIRIDPEEKVLELMRLSEPITDERTDLPDGTRSKLDQLIDAANNTEFVTLKVILHEKKEEYLKCLDLLLANKPEQMRNYIQKKRDAYLWIIEKILFLEKKLGPRDERTPKRILYNKFTQKVLDSTYILVNANPHATIGLCDAVFDGDHIIFIDRLDNYPEQQFTYLSTLLKEKHDSIKQTVANITSMNMDVDASNKSIQYLNRHLRLACKLKPQLVFSIVETACKQNCLQIEDFIDICKEHKQVEAEALLNKKLGNYCESIELYLKVIEDSFEKDISEFKKQLYYVHNYKVAMIAQEQYEKKSQPKELQQALDKKRSTKKKKEESKDDVEVQLKKRASMNKLSLRFNKLVARKYADEIVKEQTPLLEQFNRVFTRIEKIIKKHPAEVLVNPKTTVWTKIIEMLFACQRNPKLRHKEYARNWLKQYQVRIVKIVASNIEFEKLLNVVLHQRRKLKYKAIRESVADLFQDKNLEAKLVQSATDKISDDNEALQRAVLRNQTSGIIFEDLKCDLCKRQVNKSYLADQSGHNLEYFDEEDPLNEQLVLFQCPKKSDYNHCFHQRCMFLFLEEDQKKRDGYGNLAFNREKSKHDDNKDWKDRLRCAVCNDNSYDITPALNSGRSLKESARSNRGARARGGRKEKRDSSLSHHSSGSSESSSKEVPQYRINSNEAARKSLVAMRHKEVSQNAQLMARFDRDLAYGSLNIDNFKDEVFA